jgi:CRISPR-associated endoribonuclease Cas6
MRIKLSFLKAIDIANSGVVSLHHQRLLYSYVQELVESIPKKSDSYCFSTLKGTAKVSNGQIRFLSSKVSWVLSAPDSDFVNALLGRIFESGAVNVDRLSLVPRSYQIISEPEFQTVMKYICISPYMPYYQEGTDIGEPDAPHTQEFSDKAFEYQMRRMEHAGYSQEQIHSFSEFEIIPDAEYFSKVENSSKRHPRLYKNKNGEMIYGYLFPFVVHAHPEVQKFIWENGIGQYTNEGYGMLDTIPEAAPMTDSITP